MRGVKYMENVTVKVAGVELRTVAAEANVGRPMIPDEYTLVERDRMVKALPKVDLSRLRIESMEHRADFSPFGVEVTLTMRVQHRDTGEMGPISLTQQVSWRELVGIPDAYQKLVHRMAKFALLHELEECFVVNGMRVMDPHSKVPTPVHASVKVGFRSMHREDDEP